MDMSPAYQVGVAENCRHAQVVFDKFQVVQNANMAVDQVRRAGVRSGRQGVWADLHKTKWIWRKNPEHLTAQEQQHLAKIEHKNLVATKAYQMRSVLQDIYRSPHATTARRRFRVWIRWVSWVARFYRTRGRFNLMLKLAQMIEKRLPGILTHWKWGLTNAFMEGLNSIFSATKRKARGYRSAVYLITMLYFTAGKLRLLQFYFR